MSAMSETTEAIVESRYLSAGANRYAAAADWSEDGLVAFGSDANVCLWNPAVSFAPSPSSSTESHSCTLTVN